MPLPEKPLPLPGPKPEPEPEPKPKPPKPKPPKPRPEPKRDQTPPGGVPLLPDPLACAADCSESCAYYHHCLPPPPPYSRVATVHLRSSRRLPTPLIALSASLLAVSVVLLIALLVRHLVQRRRQRGRQTAPQETPLTHHDEEGVPVPAVAVEEGEDSDDGGVHHVWYIRTVGLDERAIAAITALVYDAKKCGGGVGLGGGGDDGSCAVCLAVFRDGETLRLLPRCGHAFHRGCIDTWLRAHVNCPLCRAPVQVADQAAAANAAQGAGAAGTEEADRDGAMPERAVRRAASMVALPRPAWPDVTLRAPSSNSGREGEMGLAHISRLLKFSEALEMAGIGAGRSVSFGTASGLRLPGRSGPSAAGINTDEMSR